jgi:hypothetical protein
VGRHADLCEQIAQATDRRALHLAQLLRSAPAAARLFGRDLERRVVTDHEAETAARLPAYAAVALIGVGATLIGAVSARASQSR